MEPPLKERGEQDMYKVEYSYKPSPTGERRYEQDTVGAAFTAQEAADKIREWYEDLTDLRIEHVFVDRSNRWELTEAWD